MVSSFVAWIMGISLLFDYIVNVHPELAIGEPIWVIDPIGFMIISVPTGIVFFIGLLTFFGDLLPKKELNRSP